MKILLIDAYDSFVYIIRNYLLKLGHDVDVKRNDSVKIEDLKNYDYLFLGPGPGTPEDSGYFSIIKEAEGKIPIFGICLGMQAIAAFYGMKVIKASSRKHGKVSLVRHNGDTIFHELKNPLTVTRYHSLIASSDSVVDSLVITAFSEDDGYIMGIRHNKYRIEGVQFHPESILTDNGISLISNFISYSKKIN